MCLEKVQLDDLNKETKNDTHNLTHWTKSPLYYSIGKSAYNIRILLKSIACMLLLAKGYL
jgi:hypothetical protein